MEKLLLKKYKRYCRSGWYQQKQSEMFHGINKIPLELRDAGGLIRMSVYWVCNCAMQPLQPDLMTSYIGVTAEYLKRVFAVNWLQNLKANDDIWKPDFYFRIFIQEKVCPLRQCCKYNKHLLNSCSMRLSHHSLNRSGCFLAVVNSMDFFWMT